MSKHTHLIDLKNQVSALTSENQRLKKRISDLNFRGHNDECLTIHAAMHPHYCTIPAHCPSEENSLRPPRVIPGEAWVEAKKVEPSL